MMDIVLHTVVFLIASHFIADYVFQTDAIAVGKNNLAYLGGSHKFNDITGAGDPSPISWALGNVDSGTTSGAATNKLIDAGQNFSATVTVNNSVHNTTDDTWAVVTAVDDNENLSINRDIMANSENFIIYSTSSMYTFVDGVDSYMFISCANGSVQNSPISAYVTHYTSLNSTNNVVMGTINKRPTLAGSVNTATDIDNVIDGDTSTEITVTNGGAYRDARLALKIKGGGSPPGALSRLANSITLYCYINGEDPAGGTTGDLTYYNPEYDSGTGGYGTDAGFGWTTGAELKSKDMSVEFAGRNISGEPWRWDELMNLEYIVFPVWSGAVSYAIDVSSIWLRITHIIVNDFRPIRRTGTGARTGRNNTGGRNY